MFRTGLVLVCLAFIVACNNQKETEDKEGFSYRQFAEKISSGSLPYSLTDTGLLRNRDTAAIRSAGFAAFVPDSLKSKIFGKNARVRLISLARMDQSDELSFYVIKAVAGNKRAALLMAFRNETFSGLFPFLVPDNDPATSQTSVIDKNFVITRNVAKKEQDGTVAEGREVYQFDPSSGQFSLVLNNPIDDDGGEVLNPIDTFPKKHRFSGDYRKDKRNFVSIRDGRHPNQLLVFIHVDRKEGECTGELKGDLVFTSTTTAVYRQSGDPCVMSFKFTPNSAIVKEDKGCGAHRGLDCSFDGTFPKKKEARAKPAKKRTDS